MTRNYFLIDGNTFPKLSSYSKFTLPLPSALRNVKYLRLIHANIPNLEPQITTANNTISYQKFENNAYSTVKTVTIPVGCYTLTTLADAIKSAMNASEGANASVFTITYKGTDGGLLISSTIRFALINVANAIYETLGIDIYAGVSNSAGRPSSAYNFTISSPPINFNFPSYACIRVRGVGSNIYMNSGLDCTFVVPFDTPKLTLVDFRDDAFEIMTQTNYLSQIEIELTNTKGELLLMPLPPNLLFEFACAE